MSRWPILLLNLLLFALFLDLIFGVFLAWPSHSLMSNKAKVEHDNQVIVSENAKLVAKIKQAKNYGPIYQQRLRYYLGYVAPNESFYQVNSWGEHE